MKKKIFYWGPFLSKNVATVKAILNSAISINRYSKNYEPIIINATGEWNHLKSQNIDDIPKFIDFKMNFFENLPRSGFLKSRLSYILIFLKCFFPLKKLIKEEKPDFLIIHLIVSLPLFLFLFFEFKTKLYLRISGKPKLNFFRFIFWKLSSRKISKVFCPTQETKNILMKKKIFNESKIVVLHDPILNVKKIAFLKKEKKFDKKFNNNNLILAGRLTKQKNFSFFIEAFEEVIKKNFKLKAYILGEGEEKEKLLNLIKDRKLTEKIFLLGYKNNIFKYLTNSKFFILSSLWEDPGFVLIEAASCNTSILSSDCESGPREFLGDGNGGYLFKSNDKKSLINALMNTVSKNDEELNKKKLFSKLQSRKYTIFRHYLNLERYLNN